MNRRGFLAGLLAAPVVLPDVLRPSLFASWGARAAEFVRTMANDYTLVASGPITLDLPCAAAGVVTRRIYRGGTLIAEVGPEACTFVLPAEGA